MALFITEVMTFHYCRGKPKKWFLVDHSEAVSTLSTQLPGKHEIIQILVGTTITYFLPIQLHIAQISVVTLISRKKKMLQSCIHPPTIYLSICFLISIHINLCWSFHPFLHVPSNHPLIHPTISAYNHLYIHPSINSSLHFFILPPTHCFIHPSIYTRPWRSEYKMDWYKLIRQCASFEPFFSSCRTRRSLRKETEIMGVL